MLKTVKRTNRGNKRSHHELANLINSVENEHIYVYIYIYFFSLQIMASSSLSRKTYFLLLCVFLFFNVTNFLWRQRRNHHSTLKEEAGGGEILSSSFEPTFDEWLASERNVSQFSNFKRIVAKVLTYVYIH